MRVDFKALQTAFTGVKRVTAAASLNPCDVLVYATPPTSSTYAITLPRMEDAFMCPYIIVTPENDAGTVTVQAYEGTGVYQSAAMTAAGDCLVLITDGTTWRQLIDVTT